MEKCKYRIPVKNSDINKAFSKALRGSGIAVGVGGPLRQKFCNGLCQLLTVNDIGPMECQQPEHSEKTCPDIEGLR